MAAAGSRNYFNWISSLKPHLKCFKECITKLPNLKLSENAQKNVLSTLVGEYKDNKTVPQVLDALLQRDLNINIPITKFGLTALHCATVKALNTGDTSLMEVLLDRNANPSLWSSKCLRRGIWEYTE